MSNDIRNKMTETFSLFSHQYSNINIIVVINIFFKIKRNISEKYNTNKLIFKAYNLLQLSKTV